MNGVEILSSETIYNTILPGWCGAIAFMATIALCVCACVCADRRKNTSVIICCALVAVSIIVMTLSLSSNKNNISHIEYKVTIDDSVSMNEFLDKYEILDQEGKIYTVKERE